MDLAVENLIESAKVRSMAPISQSTFDDTRLITIANDEMLLGLVASIVSVREDFFVTTKLIPIRASVSHYQIPKNAIGGSLKFVRYVDSAGNRSKPLSHVDAERSNQYQASSGNQPSAFSLQGDEIVIYPAPTSAVGSLEVCFPAKPNRLIATSKCAAITAIANDGTTVSFTVDTDLTTSLVVGAKVDILSGKSPFLLWNSDVVITAINSTTISVATTSTTDAAGVVEVNIGDFICPAGYANIPMLPEEFHPVLAQRISNRLLSALGEIDKFQAGLAIYKEMLTDALKLIKNRVENSPERVVRRNGLVNAFSRY